MRIDRGGARIEPAHASNVSDAAGRKPVLGPAETGIGGAKKSAGFGKGGAAIGHRRGDPRLASLISPEEPDEKEVGRRKWVEDLGKTPDSAEPPLMGTPQQREAQEWAEMLVQRCARSATWKKS